jgi:hypothetical protein
MANPIDIIISKDALDAIDKAIKKVSDLDKQIQDTALSFIENSNKMNKAMSSVTPIDVSESIEGNSKLTAELERQAVIIKGLTAEIDKLKKVKAENKKLTAEELLERRILNKTALDEAKATSNLVGQYDKLSLAHQKAFKNAQNLGAQYGGTSKEFIKAAEKANKLDIELKNIDATLNKHTRNVGNYTGGYNALGMSINQLTREAPAFANSLNTGFMALSNNFPALFDAINGIRTQNKALAAEGKPTVSVLRQLVGAIFSWQTLISVGVTLLTLYGGKIVEWAKGLSKGAKAQEDLNKAMAEGAKNAGSEVAKMDVLYRTATNVNLTLEQRKKAVDQLQKQYPSYFKNIADEVIMNGKAKKSYDELKDAILASSKAKAIEAELQKRASERLEKELEIQQRIKDARQRILDLQKNPDAGQNDPTVGGKSFTSYQDRFKTAMRVLGSYKTDLEEFYRSARNEDDLLFKALEENRKKSEKYEADTISPVKTGKTKSTRAERAKIEAQALKSVADTISQINQQLDNLRTTAITGSESERAQANKDIEDLIELKKKLNALPTASTTILQPAKKEDVDNMRALSAEAKAYMETFTQDFIGQSGFTNTFKILNDEIDGFGENASVTFNAIAESAQEMFNFIANASQQNFDAEYARLESQKDIALKFAGDSTSGKKKIEEDYEKKRKEIQNRENKAKQKQALFNTAIDLAQAIVASFIRDPTGITAAIIAGIGAVQIGFIAAQKIPQYFDGGTHGGGLAMINDAGGSNYVETVVTPDGKVQQFQGRNVITDLPNGTEIFTPEQWQQKELEYMINSKGITMNNQSSGMTAKQMDKVLSKHFSKIQTNHTVFDKKGISQWSTYNGNKTIRNENLANSIGFNV